MAQVAEPLEARQARIPGNGAGSPVRREEAGSQATIGALAAAVGRCRIMASRIVAGLVVTKTSSPEDEMSAHAGTGSPWSASIPAEMSSSAGTGKDERHRGVSVSRNDHTRR